MKALTRKILTLLAILAVAAGSSLMFQGCPENDAWEAPETPEEVDPEELPEDL